jgi:GT2 family glycosyltransferase
MVPQISVVIPTFNRRARLALVLDALKHQTIAAERFEVVVVDDGSQDGTADWLEAVQLPFALRVLRQANKGPAAARNAGVENARAPLLLFIDDDVVPVPEMIGEHLASQAAEPDVAVMGPLGSLPLYTQPWIAWEQAKLEKQYRAMLRGAWAPTYRQFWTGNASLPRQWVLDASGFDVTLKRAEDIELAARLAQRGLRFRFNPRAVGMHHAERSLAAWARMHSSYGSVEPIIHGRFGREHVLETLAANWRGLHPAVKALVRSCIGRPQMVAMVSRSLMLAIEGAAAVGLEGPAHVACSMLANVNYWSGSAETLGVDELRAQIFARPPPTGSNAPVTG